MKQLAEAAEGERWPCPAYHQTHNDGDEPDLEVRERKHRVPEAAADGAVNLLPLWPLDGGRGFRALSRGQRWALVAVFGALWLVTRDGLLVLLGIVGVVRLFGPAEASQSDRIAFAQYALLAVVLSALSQIPVATP